MEEEQERFEPMTLMKMLTTSLTWYLVPACLSFVIDAVMLSEIPKRTAEIQRTLSSFQMIGIALVSSLLRSNARMFQQLEWLAVVLLMVSIPVILAHSLELEEQPKHGANDLAFAMLLAALLSLLIPVLEYMYCAERLQNRSLYAQNVLYFGVRVAFLAVALPMGDIPRGRKLFAWESSDVLLCALIAADGLVLPQVLARGGVQMYLMITAIATAVFALTISGSLDILWACGVCVCTVAIFLIMREYRVRRLVEGVSRIHAEEDDEQDLP
uniref:Transmembrane protein n=1 Tax=Lotharella oceanica TaxID=641309 RepID=A0A7S2U009_9EUKA